MSGISKWLDVVVWGGSLLITGYLMGGLCERKNMQVRETYHGVLMILRHCIQLLEPVGGSLRRVIPIILAHHDKFDGTGYNSTSGEQIPIESRIITVADVYDSLTSDRPYRKAMSPFEARDIIAKGADAEFDPKVVNAFLKAFRQGKLEAWAAPLTAA